MTRASKTPKRFCNGRIHLEQAVQTMRIVVFAVFLVAVWVAQPHNVRLRKKVCGYD